jgi:hypothetical protein
MAYNLITSYTATPYTISGTFGTAGLGTQGLKYSALSQRTLGGVVMYVQQNSTSALTIVPLVVSNKINSTAGFAFCGTFGMCGTGSTAGTISIVIPAGTANYRIPLPVLPSEHTVLVSAQFASAGTNCTAWIDFADEGVPEIGGQTK